MTSLRAAGSRPARRAYLTTFLLVSGSVFLLFLAAFIYILFYINYVPQVGLTQPVYLEYTPAKPPRARFTLPPSSIIPNQAYTVTTHLRLPSSPNNILIGNFMINLDLLSPTNERLASSRRPAIMTYRSPFLERIDTLVRAPLLVSGWQRQEEKLSVVLLEDIVLDTEVGGVIVSVVTSNSGPETGLGIYDVAVEFRANFKGVRWLMYNYRIMSFLVAAAVFWAIEVTFMVAVWWGVYSYFSAPAPPSGPQTDADALEDGEDYDQQVLGYPTPASTPGLEANGDGGEEVYADDEVSSSSFEEDEKDLVDIVGDSGLGSMSESAGSSARAGAAGAGGQRRRRA